MTVDSFLAAEVVAPAPLAPRPPAAPIRQVAARLIDLMTVLVAMWCLVVVQVLGFVGSLAQRYAPDPWGAAFVPLVVFTVMYAGYELVYLVLSRGQTPGMDVMRIRAVAVGHHADEAGLTLGRALRRWAVSGWLPLVWPLWAAALLLAATAAPLMLPGGRTLHDLAAGTRVVPYDRDVEDPTTRRPHSRRAARERRRIETAGAEADRGTRAT